MPFTFILLSLYKASKGHIFSEELSENSFLSSEKYFARKIKKIYQHVWGKHADIFSLL